MKRSVLLILLALNIVWAGSYSATKALMAHAPFFLVTSMRYFIAAVPLILLAGSRYGLRMPRRDFLRCAVMGIATFTLCPLLMYAGVAISRASDAAVLTATEPLLVSLGAFLYLREKIEGRTAAGLILAFGGTLILSGFWQERGTVNPFGVMLILGGVFFEACYSVIGKELLQRHPPLVVTAIAIVSACVVNAIALTVLGIWKHASGLTPGDWMLLTGYLSLLCTFFGYTFWYVALKEDSASKVTITIFLQPVFGILIAWLWLAEIPTPAQIAGTAIILFAVAVAVIRPKEISLPPA